MSAKSVVGKRKTFFLTFFYIFLKIGHFYLNPIYNSSQLDF